MYRFSVFGVEANHFQEMMVNDLRRRAKDADVKLPVKQINNRSNKQSRIANLEPEVTQGRIQFCRRHQLFLDQLRQFPFAAHDDGPDALEMAVEASRQLIIPSVGAPVILRRGH
jgi:predicted phage terminase large subunit-like protein